MALGISQRDIQNYETPTVTAVIPPVSQAEVIGENIAAPFKGVAAGVESTYQTLATGATSAIAGILPSREQMFAAANAGMPVPEDIAQLDPEQIRTNQAVDAAHAMANLRPDPRKSGTAAQVLFGLTSGATRFVAGTAAAGPLGGAALVGTTEGTMTRDELMAAGVDRKTANMLGLGSGVFAGTAALLPGGYGSSLAARVTSGAAAQLTLGVSQREMMSSVLADAGYTEQAAQYRPLDGAAMMADAALGATFGLVHHVFAPPEAIDSAHTIKDSQQIERSAGGPAADTASRNAVVDNAVASAERLIEGNGEPPQTADVRYVPDATQDAAREATANEAESAAAEAGAGRVESLDAFHGTNAAFEHYSIEQNLGPHFGNAEQANLYTSREAGGGGGNIRPVVLNFDNAVRVPHLHWEDPVILAGQLRDLGIIPLEVIERLKGGPENRIADFSILRKVLLDNGIDSFVYKDKFDNSKSDSYIALKPAEQVKSKFESSSLSRSGRAQARAKAEGEASAKLSPETQEVLAQAKEALSRNEGLKVHDEEGNPIEASAALQRELDNVKNAASDGELAKVAAACFGRG